MELCRIWACGGKDTADTAVLDCCPVWLAVMLSLVVHTSRVIWIAAEGEDEAWRLVMIVCREESEEAAVLLHSYPLALRFPPPRA